MSRNQKTKPKWWFTADWHAYHNNILTYVRRTEFMNSQERRQLDDAIAANEERPRIHYSRETMNRMHDGIINGINAVVGPDDILWNLGDVMFGGRELNDFHRRLQNFRRRINCNNVHLIFGNHDKALKWWRPKSLEKEQVKAIFGNKVYSQTLLNVYGQNIMLNHYLMGVWEYNHKEGWMLYGHSHGSAEPWREEHIPNGRLIDVGIDNHYRLGGGYTPFSFEELQDIMKIRGGEAIDHHKPGRNRHK